MTPLHAARSAPLSPRRYGYESYARFPMPRLEGLWHHSPRVERKAHAPGARLASHPRGAGRRRAAAPWRAGAQDQAAAPAASSRRHREDDEQLVPAEQPGIGVEASLAALDDVMQMLSSLHAKPAAGRGRRGRIDIASLIWEVAPEARVAIEPGSGTEVFCDEGEIRRMLHVLARARQRARLVRHDQARRRRGARRRSRSGPDSSATAETERAWLSRMAIRYGGRYELEGGARDAHPPRRRRRRARRARRAPQGARRGPQAGRGLRSRARRGLRAGRRDGSAASQSSFPPRCRSRRASERFAVLSRFAGGVAAELRALLSPLGREIQALKSQQTVGPPGMSSRPPPPPRSDESEEDRLETMRRRLVFGAGLPLRRSPRWASSIPAEPPVEVDIADLARTAVRGLGAAPRAPRRRRGSRRSRRARRSRARAPRAVAVLLREITSQAIAATSRGGRVKLTVTPQDGRRSARASRSTTPGPRSRLRRGARCSGSSSTRARTAARAPFRSTSRPRSPCWQGGLLELGRRADRERRRRRPARHSHLPAVTETCDAWCRSGVDAHPHHRRLRLHPAHDRGARLARAATRWTPCRTARRGSRSPSRRCPTSSCST